MYSWVLFLSTGLVFISTFLLTLAVYNFIFGTRIQIARRVNQIVGENSAALSARDLELSQPLYQRAIRPALQAIARLMTRFIPATREAEMEKKVVAAGTPGNLTAREWIVLKYLAATGLGLLFWTWSMVISTPLPQSIILTICGIPLGWLMPDLFLNSRIRQRKANVEKKLPDVLDLLTVSVEAGLGFEGAMMKVAEKTSGVLADEFILMLQECHMGKPRREALRDMADRVGVDDLSSFCGSVILADTLGISIGNVLRTQAQQMRLKRRQRTEELAMKAPIKMLFPMVLFIFPAIFIILLGPAVLQIIKAFHQ
ncbi:type II secretion system F family protein [Desulfurispora thermophila]|uniref:type II secretion system F family protein n=1 Tax=Desulfurispora thermophila TaxID=265470 RepID=UPI00035F38CE|nr:type II secretion system F family protein [Desulfurispora thermophila]